MKKIINFITIITMCISLTGCWDLTESESLALVTVIGIDTTKDDEIKVIAQEMTDVKQTSGSKDGKTSNKAIEEMHEATAPTISEAIEKISASDSRRFYFAHANAIILSEELVSSKGVRDFIDFFQRNPEIRRNTWLLISKRGELPKIFSTSVSIESGNGIGNIIMGVVHNKQNNSFISINTLGEFLNLFWETGSEPYTAGIHRFEITTGNTNISKNNSFDLKIDNTAVFKDEKLIGWLNNDESRGLLLAKGRLRGGNLSVQLDQKEIALHIVRMNSKIKPVLSVDKMEINLSVKIVSNIIESQADLNYLKPETIKIIEDLQSEEVKRQIFLTFDKSKELNSDVFGFGNYFYGKNPSIWRAIQNEKSNYIENIKLNVDVKSIVNQIGLVKENKQLQ